MNAPPPPRRVVSSSALRFGTSAWLLMLAAGSMYGLGAIQKGLPRWTGCSEANSAMPFGTASLGLALGCHLAGRTHDDDRWWSARTIAALGGSIWAAGLLTTRSAIRNGSFPGVCVALGFGGIGVGLVYLTVVVNVSRRFSSNPRVGGFIGPLGFATGTALTLVYASYRPFDPRATTHLAGAQGLIVALATGSTVAVLPSKPEAPQAQQRHETKRSFLADRAASPSSSSNRPRHLRAFFWLVFANALPGMTLLGIALPLVSGPTDLSSAPPDRDAYHAVAYTTIALFLGGFFASHLCRRLGGIKGAFVALLELRSFALLLCSFHPAGKTTTTLTLALVLFGHGFGFSVLPGLIKKDGDPVLFCREYGSVLVAWGLAGFLGSWVNVATSGSGMGPAGSLGFCGVVTGVSAVILSRSRLADAW